MSDSAPKQIEPSDLPALCTAARLELTSKRRAVVAPAFDGVLNLLDALDSIDLGETPPTNSFDAAVERPAMTALTDMSLRDVAAKDQVRRGLARRRHPGMPGPGGCDGTRAERLFPHPGRQCIGGGEGRRGRDFRRKLPRRTAWNPGRHQGTLRRGGRAHDLVVEGPPELDRRHRLGQRRATARGGCGDPRQDTHP